MRPGGGLYATSIVWTTSTGHTGIIALDLHQEALTVQQYSQISFSIKTIKRVYYYLRKATLKHKQNTSKLFSVSDYAFTKSNVRLETRGKCILVNESIVLRLVKISKEKLQKRTNIKFGDKGYVSEFQPIEIFKTISLKIRFAVFLLKL